MTVKRTISLIGIIALAVVIGFFTAACGDGGDDGGGDGGGGGGPTFLGNTLELSGQVYLPNYTETSITYQKFNGNLTIDDDLGGSGAVINGKLTYTIGIPDSSKLETIGSEWDIDEDSSYDNITISNQNAKGVMLESFNLNDSTYHSLYKANETASMNSKGYSGTFETVGYVYVDRNVTISGKGKTRTYGVEDGYVYPHSSTTKDYSIALKTGWNAVYMKQTHSTTSTGTTTVTISMSLGNPSLKWILDGYEEED